MLFIALFLVLEWYRTRRVDGRLHMVIFWADRMVCNSLPLSLAVEAANHTVYR